MASAPTILVFDSGLGGLTVHREVAAARPDARYVYVADDAFFPYSERSEADLVERVAALMATLIDTHHPALVVIACNTASTLVLPELRARFAVPFVGTVPAIKPACAASTSKRVSVLGTEATVSREYTRALIRDFANGAEVTLVGSARLAGYAESELNGTPAEDAALAAEIAPCFVDRDGRRTDMVVLACTHYPLLVDRFQRLAPWPVAFYDPAPAIARRVLELVGPPAHDRAARGAIPVHLRSTTIGGARRGTGALRHRPIALRRTTRSSQATGDTMAKDPTTVRRTLQFKFTLPTSDATHLLSLLKAARPFHEAFGGKKFRLLQNVDDPARYVHEIEYETHELIELNRQRFASDARVQATLQSWRAMLGGSIEIDVYQEVE